jgi:hypothetical protein
MSEFCYVIELLNDFVGERKAARICDEEGVSFAM